MSSQRVEIFRIEKNRCNGGSSFVRGLVWDKFNVDIFCVAWYNVNKAVIILSQKNKLLLDILSGTKDNNIKFDDLRTFLLQLNFKERIKGDHFIYKRSDIPERINIQPNGNMAKSYQVRQIRNLIVKYNLRGE